MPNPKFHLQDIYEFGPCYDPRTYLPEDWEGTTIDLLHVEACPAIDRLFVVLRDTWIVDPKILRTFAISCARQAVGSVPNPDTRSTEGLNIAERFLDGAASQSEVDTARYNASYAVQCDEAYSEADWPDDYEDTVRTIGYSYPSEASRSSRAACSAYSAVFAASLPRNTLGGTEGYRKLQFSVFNAIFHCLVSPEELILQLISVLPPD